MASILATWFLFQQLSQRFSNICLISATFFLFQQLRISATCVYLFRRTSKNAKTANHNRGDEPQASLVIPHLDGFETKKRLLAMLVTYRHDFGSPFFVLTHLRWYGTKFKKKILEPTHSPAYFPTTGCKLTNWFSIVNLSISVLGFFFENRNFRIDNKHVFSKL